MPIKCEICDAVFEKIIPWQHLKTHNISSSEYKIQYGNLYSPETLEKHSQKIPHNKGKKINDEQQRINHQLSIKKREERYKNGEFTRGGKKTDEQKHILSLKSSEYAKNNPEEVKSRAKKAAITKKENNTPGPMTGKKHTESTRQKISERTTIANIKKSNIANIAILERIQLSNLTLINNIVDTTLTLSCNTCNNQFQFNKQIFHLSRYKEKVCPHCYPRQIKKSAGELELFAFISSIDNSAISGFRESYNSSEIDIYIPSKHVGFEFNGLYWHSESVLVGNNKSPQSDYEKYKSYKSKGIQIITILEDEWHNQRNIVESRIKSILGYTTNKIYARQCKIQEVSSTDAANFCEINHIMGKARSNYRVGLYYNNVLISLMTFSKNNISRKVNTWEINRFASILDSIVVGGASRLFNHFIKQVAPETVVSYSDNRWSNGKLYSTLGFEKVSDGAPNYWYFTSNSMSRIHRYTLRKSKNDDSNLTEWENRQNQGYNRIWDCGSSKWIWNMK